MPGFEELEYYFRGLWLLIKGRQEGGAWLDFTMRGFWRSWWAVVFCLPPTVLSWLAFRETYIDSLPAGAHVDSIFFAKLAIMEVANWTVPIALVAMIAIGTGLSRFVVPVVVATNWFSVPLQWLYSTQSAIQLLVPGSDGATAFLFLIFLGLSIGLHYRIIRSITGGDALIPAAMVICLFVGSFLTQYQLTTAFDLWINS
jgi:hypothetical protein